MRRFVAPILVMALAACAAQPQRCAIPGERMQWVADYCMAKLQTDDEIAAARCIEEERDAAFADDCAAKGHYKAKLCELAISREVFRGPVASCVADPDFAGTAVRNGGVGGR